MTNSAVKDIRDAHRSLGRAALTDTLNAAVDAKLSLNSEPAPKSAKSDKNPRAPESGEIVTGFADYGTGVSLDDEPFPIECLTGAAGAMAREVARAAMVPTTLTAMNVLGILAASIGAGLVLCSGGDRLTRANLYLMPVAPSGTGKGQSFGAIARPLLDLERARVIEWKEGQRREALAAKKVAEARLAGLSAQAKVAATAKEKAAICEEMQQLQATIDAAEQRLREPVWSTEQATKEAIEYLVTQGSREALASISAEARGAVDTLMGRYREATDESIFLAGYSGDPVRIHRRHADAIILQSPCITLLWLLQPDKLRALLESPAMSEGGLMPRFLLADTKAEPVEEPENPESISPHVKESWVDLIEELVATFHERQADAAIVQPERGAREVIRSFHNAVVQRRKAGGDLADIQIFAARWAENAWRLMLVLHAAEHGARAAEVPVSIETAERAVRLVQWFADSQLRLLASGREELWGKQMIRVKEILQRSPDRSRPLRDFERRNRITEMELRQLQEKFPGVFVIETIATGAAGRPARMVRLC